jgi:hypothetical protein
MGCISSGEGGTFLALRAIATAAPMMTPPSDDHTTILFQ